MQVQPVNVTERQTEWTTVNWRQANRQVRNLRQRIFRASQAGDLKKVRSLQKLMLRSYSNKLVSVRRVTQTNKGKNTPGVDKVVVKTPEARGKLVDLLTTYEPWKQKPAPARRVYIPKANGKRRPLGIPTVIDRAMQAVVKNALEPAWEAKFEGISYGFRPGRGCHDAIGKIYLLARPNKTKKWVVDADIKGAFDNIAHETILDAIVGFPARELIKQWLKAGYVEHGAYYDTETGTPQGGVISPLLANIALHGMEKALRVTYDNRGQIRSKSAVVRYADDFVVFCETKEDAEKSVEILKEWLNERGLTLSEEKTKIVHLTEGFDFLGFNIKHYEAPQTSNSGYKLLIKPSRKSVQRTVDDLREHWLSLRGHNVIEAIQLLNPVIRGKANYYRIGVATEIFAKLDNWMHSRTYRHVKRMHPHKSKQWRDARYYGRLNKARGDNWVFGDKQSGAYLLKFAWFPIERHGLVKGTASPDDPSLREYWEKRNRRKNQDLKPNDKRVADRQNGICPNCGDSLHNGEETQRHHVLPRRLGGRDGQDNEILVHLFCQQQIHSGKITPHDATGNLLLKLK